MNQEKIFFITDSACDIPVEEEKNLSNLSILPIPVAIDGKGYYERESFTPQEFYDLLDTCQNIPTTSHIPAITFQEKYEEAMEQGYTHVVVVTICGKGSAMFQSATLAKQNFEEEHPNALTIEILDSNCYTMGYGYPLIQACHKAEQGESCESIVAYLKDYLKHLKIYFSPFTLKYVKKSGRVSCAAAFVGEMLGLRPIINAIGSTEIVSKVRGNAAVLTSIEKMFSQEHKENTPYMIAVGRETPASAELAAACEKIAGYPPEGVFHIGAAIAMNSGPELIGLLFQSKE